MLFSVITVTRNNIAGLARTHASLASQDFRDFEWIVIDGASDDGTAAFLPQSGAHYISEPDHGIYDAMNKGIDRAQGFFLLFLNAGDTLAAAATLGDLAAYIHALQETPDFVYGDALETRPGQPPATKPARPYKNAAWGMFTHHQAMLYRRDLIGDLRYDTKIAIAADYEFTLRFLKNCAVVVYAPFPLCLFESGGISQRRAAAGRREQFAVRRALRTVSPAQNALIFLLQKMIWTGRRLCPTLYWFIKSAYNKPEHREQDHERQSR